MTSSYALTTEAVKSMLDHLATTCPHIKSALELVDYPKERRADVGYPYLMRIISGQQLSVKAAASIWQRVELLLDGDVTPENYLSKSDESLRAAGFSFQKIKYGRSLSEAVRRGDLDPHGMDSMRDDEILKSITAVKGFGRWSAEMYMMFSLGRENVWPVGDLAVRKGVGRILGIDEPTEKEMDKLGERWQPYRSAVALLCWHYYSNAPF
ncbi:DNA-3-methyladenine glycosylase 2 family protein [Temperatibacter marinus]|uniref:DNA-3-methyladenine glycosylase II n=1 Tax=Temperatibacter marinus TaxID=1456591 RepID=A0AA52H9L9_9PROT|nr:DNA-3-methyladenine glycosylase 2 family protein [Temperatibacter marinus]WND03054.1 DNA-3-methyladenine glycosylase 2 family protein [Temperatibacter marinus]